MNFDLAKLASKFIFWLFLLLTTQLSYGNVLKKSDAEDVIALYKRGSDLGTEIIRTGGESKTGKQPFEWGNCSTFLFRELQNHMDTLYPVYVLTKIEAEMEDRRDEKTVIRALDEIIESFLKTIEANQHFLAKVQIDKSVPKMENFCPYNNVTADIIQKMQRLYEDTTKVLTKKIEAIR